MNLSHNSFDLDILNAMENSLIDMNLIEMPLDSFLWTYPPEIIETILAHMDYKSLCNISCTCTRLKDFVEKRDASLWKKLSIDQFGESSKGIYYTWKDFFRSKLEETKTITIRKYGSTRNFVYSGGVMSSIGVKVTIDVHAKNSQLKILNRHLSYKRDEDTTTISSLTGEIYAKYQNGVIKTPHSVFQFTVTSEIPPECKIVKRFSSLQYVMKGSTDPAFLVIAVTIENLY